MSKRTYLCPSPFYHYTHRVMDGYSLCRVPEGFLTLFAPRLQQPCPVCFPTQTVATVATAFPDDLRAPATADLQELLTATRAEVARTAVDRLFREFVRCYALDYDVEKITRLLREAKEKIVEDLTTST